MPQWLEFPPNDRSAIEAEISAKPVSKKKIAKITVIVASAGAGNKRKIMPKINATKPPPREAVFEAPPGK